MGMSEKSFLVKAIRLQWWAAGAILVATTGLTGSAQAQTANPAGAAPNKINLEASPLSPPSTGTGSADSGVVQAGCSTCGGALPGMPGWDGCEGGCGEGCVPGRRPCCPCDAKTCVGRFFCDFAECICCPDPCYDPRWIGVANAAFFVDAARPMTQMRVRYDAGLDMRVPARNEFFWARADGTGRGPKPPAGCRGEIKLDYNELTMTTEAASGAFSLA